MTKKISEWCSCEKTADCYPDAFYVDDTLEMKHHWRCSICSGIVQIG